MGYQALYRVWRPQRFDEIVGQQVITQTLKNALVTDQISHAYLFNGPRGTGKTSTAKILAKAVNCEHLKDGEPCNECDICVAINNGSLNDVIEIDAASNNGVEEIRNIRDKAKYAPTEAKYKVYIIDEVHMLSIGAFNALLKTLEEPPEHVIFILATTEPHKIPATIISRVQRFDFKRIQAKDILEQMEKILDSKKIKYDDRALKVIAKSAEGGMRDALSILDQVLSYSDDEITYDSALQVTGSVARDDLQAYMQAIINGDVSVGLKEVQAILNNGKDASQFIEDLINYCQNILLYKQDSEMVEASELGLLGDDFKEIAEKVKSSKVYYYVETMNDVQRQLRSTYHPDVYLDILTVKLANQPAETTPVSQPNVKKTVDTEVVSKLQLQIDALTKQLEQVKQAAPVQTMTKPVPRETATKNDNSKATVDFERVSKVLGSATRANLTAYQSQWDDVMNLLSVTQRALMHVSKPVAASADGIVVAFNYAFLYQKAGTDNDLMDALQNAMDRVFGKVPDIIFVPIDEWPGIRKEYLANNLVEKHSKPGKENVTEEQQTKNEAVEKAQELFGNDIVKVEDN
ncbi:DNA polymerase III subunit gamma/tau [Fructilactobacillus sanfranciscensis]|uniref:DNA polymerase III subunit gamma/tau n=1 Tax=Fructilactobacillus sanfranciscensis TaxID=1625 RepID=UPI0012EC5B83|nr:DNA polymerase III subunit gamma/tau [Fructilactobacillus sanfranciscensis]MVF15412.1 DNA polymerase III subunit gamma/tau [Fructilactobacillus sanfranciscensis]